MKERKGKKRRGSRKEPAPWHSTEGKEKFLHLGKFLNQQGDQMGQKGNFRGSTEESLLTAQISYLVYKKKKKNNPKFKLKVYR